MMTQQGWTIGEARAQHGLCRILERIRTTADGRGEPFLFLSNFNRRRPAGTCAERQIKRPRWYCGLAATDLDALWLRAMHYAAY